MTDNVLRERLHREMGLVIEDTIIPNMDIIGLNRLSNAEARQLLLGQIRVARATAQGRLLKKATDSGDELIIKRMQRDVFRRMPRDQRIIFMEHGDENQQLVNDMLNLAITLGIADMTSDELPPSIREQNKRRLEQMKGE